jgi:hypothetical protein
MISTHCEAAPWFKIKEESEYETKKQEIGEKLLQNARKV